MTRDTEWDVDVVPTEPGMADHTGHAANRGSEPRTGATAVDPV